MRIHSDVMHILVITMIYILMVSHMFHINLYLFISAYLQHTPIVYCYTSLKMRWMNYSNIDIARTPIHAANNDFCLRDVTTTRCS